MPKLAEALRARGLAAPVTRSGESHFVPLPRTWSAYLRELGSSRRYVVTRSLRELDRWAGKGGWEVRSAVTASDLDEGRRVLHDLHAERWTAAGRRTAPSPAPASSASTTRSCPASGPARTARRSTCSGSLVRGEPIAASYNVVFDNKVYFYQSGRRIDVPKTVRPGIAMHALAIQRSIEAGRREYDFLQGASRYKRDLALGSRALVTLRAVAPHLRARAVEAARMLAERAIAQMRSRRRRSAERRRTTRPEQPVPE